MIGGLLAFGLIGVFLGPTLVAIAHTLLLAWLQGAFQTGTFRSGHAPVSAPHAA